MSDGSPSPTPVCPRCVQLEADRRARSIGPRSPGNAHLQERLNRNSSNSSIPPSANPLECPQACGQDPERAQTGRANGDILDIIAIASRPSGSTRSCRMCPRSAPTARLLCPPNPDPNDPEPTWHQVAELPELAAVITEHQGHARTCPCCGHLNRGEIPPGDPRPCHRATLGRGDVLLQRSSSSEPTGCGGGRRDGLRGADLPGFRLRAGSRDERRLGQSVSGGPGGGP